MFESNVYPTAAVTAPNWRAMLNSSATEVFEVMLGRPLRSEESLPKPQGSMVTAFVGIGGDVQGVVSIITSVSGAHMMTAAMLGDSSDPASDSTGDALGEICNMIAGSFKGKLAGTADHCVLSLPTVVMGADYCMRVLNDGLTVESMLSFEGHPVRLLLELHQ